MNYYFPESLSHWSGEIEDLDTDQLVSAFCSPVEERGNIKREQDPEASRCRNRIEIFVFIGLVNLKCT